jgi:phosphoketolase
VIRVYLPPDANTLLSVTDHCLRSRNYVNVIVAGKQPAPQWLTMDEAVKHRTAGLGIWEPDVVMACCGDVPTLETLAAVQLVRQYLPDLKVRVVNVVDLMTLQPHEEHPHGLTDRDFDIPFTTDKPIIFAFHGYPTLIHRLTYSRQADRAQALHRAPRRGPARGPRLALGRRRRARARGHGGGLLATPERRRGAAPLPRPLPLTWGILITEDRCPTSPWCMRRGPARSCRTSC